MTRILICALALAALLVPASASAQRVEVGGSVGLGRRGSEGSLVEGPATAMNGVHAGLSWGDRVETTMRVAWWRLPYPHGWAGYPRNCTGDSPSTCEWFRVNFDRVTPRRFVAGEVVYHFRRGQRIRPFVGGGYGRMDASEDVSCDTPGCESLFTSDFRFGRREASAADPIAIGGVSYAVTPHLLIRGVIRMHRFGGESLSTLETAVGAGVKF